MSRIFTRPHLVWGWTGTLTDDTDRYVQALNIALRPLGARQVGLDTFRRQFTTSSSALFAAILGRTLTPRERQQASIAFETHLAHRPPVQLRPGTEQLLARLIRSGCTHSALSLSRNHVVTQQISDLGIARFFIRTEGLSDASVRTKAHPLADHVRALRPDIGNRPIVVIGDDADDIRAAVANHVHPVPFTGGRTRPGILSQFGLPVAGTLAQAAAFAVAYAHTTRIESCSVSNGANNSRGLNRPGMARRTSIDARVTSEARRDQRRLANATRTRSTITWSRTAGPCPECRFDRSPRTRNKIMLLTRTRRDPRIRSI